MSYRRVQLKSLWANLEASKANKIITFFFESSSREMAIGHLPLTRERDNTKEFGTCES